MHIQENRALISHSQISEIFKVHPRTVERVMSEKLDVPFRNAESEWKISEVAEKFKIAVSDLNACIAGEDEILTSKEAANALGIGMRVFYLMRESMGHPTPLCKWTVNSIRYSRNQLGEVK